MTLPYRPNPLEYPLSPAQVQGLNDTLENIYTELRRLSASSSTHEILSATHSDSTPATEADGDILIRSGDKWIRLPIGAAKYFLQVVSGLPAWGVDGSLLEDLNAAELTGTVPVSSILHNMLSAVHEDSVPASAVLGDVIVAQQTGVTDLMPYWFDGLPADLIPNPLTLGAQQFWFDGSPSGVIASALAAKWKRKAIGSSGHVPISNGTDWDWGPASSAVGVVGASVYRSTNIFVADATPTAIPLSTVTTDDSAFWSSGSPTRLTVPSGKAGWYAIVGGAAADAGLGTGAFWVEVYVNGTRKARELHHGNLSAGYYVNGQAVALIYLSAADYVELYVEFWNTAGSGGWTVIGGAPHTFLQMVKL